MTEVKAKVKQNHKLNEKAKKEIVLLRHEYGLAFSRIAELIGRKHKISITKQAIEKSYSTSVLKLLTRMNETEGGDTN